METYEKTQVLEAQELAYAWERTGISIDTIALMHLKLQERLEIVQGENAVLEQRLSKGVSK